MATWKQIKDFLRGNFNIAEDTGDMFKLIFSVDGDDRSQVIFIEKIKSQNRDLWVELSSPVGVIEEDEINDALEILDNTMCGGMVKKGNLHFVRHCMPIDNVDGDDFVAIMSVIVGVADKLEERFVGGDSY